jgi:3-dehydroquinate dehydratase/shikimate dehydrogenase
MSLHRPVLCITVNGRTMADIRRARDEAFEADLVELRLDGVSDPDVAAALADRRRPVIVTCRPAWEGGAFDGSEEERRRILAAALEAGADFVDLEWRAGFTDLIRAHGSRVVCSLHDYDGVPHDLDGCYRAMRGTGAAVVKLAVAPQRLCDLLPLLAIGRAAVSRKERAALIGMGIVGVPSRVLAAHFGSCWSYAGAAAPGQLSADRMLGEFRYRDITSASRIYGVVGSPIGHSLSPAMHNAAFRAAFLDAAYVPLQAADAADFVEFARALGMSGASVTAPFKRTLMPTVSKIDEDARRIGALNTIRVDRDGWAAVNTDVAAFLEPLRRRITIGGARAAVLGAGGAARAVTVGLGRSGADVTVYARDVERAQEVASLANGIGRTLPPVSRSWDILVNATPVGTAPRIDESLLAAGDWVPAPPGPGVFYDLVYNPAETRMMREAAAAGCVTIGGLEMLVGQAQQQFLWWTGTRVAAAVFREAAEQRLGNRVIQS